jgi:nitrogen fixation NifU-like protein
VSDLDDLYQELILDHGRRPRNHGRLPGADHSAEGWNPLCGDHFHVDLALRDGRVADIRFDGSGCAISTSSASLMTEAVRGLTVAEAELLFDRVHALVTGTAESDGELGKLEAFAGVRNFPLRVKCATLAWHTLRAALRGDSNPVSTE